MEIVPRPDGLITRDQSAQLAGVTPHAITMWSTRGYLTRDGERCKLPVTKREGRTVLYDPVEVAKAEYATRQRARRFPLAA
jgi:hypothetical protein